MSDLGRLIANRYRLVERVGRGGMGTVWRAEDELLNRHVALKKLHVPPHLHEDEVQRLHERTRREARSAARITHPHVIVVHDVVDDEGLPCIVMEYVPSVTLGDVLKRRGALSPGEAARIGRGMASALRAAHDAGVLHRDVKPANVLLGDDGRIVLTDFGIAVESGTSSLTRTGELVGSIQYLAPERLRTGIAEPGPACDLWSLGTTLYEAVEGRPPFGRDTAIETAYAIAADPYEPPRRAKDLAPVIEGLLVKEPDRRMNAQEAEHLLSRVSGEATVPLDPPTRPEPLRTTAPDTATPAAPGRKRGRRTALWIASALVAAALVTGGLLLRPGGDADSRDDSPNRSQSQSPSPSPSTSSGSGNSTDPGSAASPSPVPAGYHLVKAGQGFSVPVPDGWTAKDVPSGEVAYIDPSGLVGLRVEVVEFAGSDPLQHWRDTEEDQTRRDNPGYERVRMSRTEFRGRPAGYWEFTFQGRAREFRGVELAFSGADSTQYVIYLSGPNATWNEHRPIFDTAVNGIRLRD
ncbi:serine/threonine-protein kinase [Streptomyces muensis]|uniref:non-specific serine/threonine protein kinase n=1 Tax=Streptomyces muensis TaxID=1077944 RepID=A0A9X1Q8C8_STRM4|nr:serine/threonine-protein kinase [Streptomyces muensis]MCF1600063.1 serine/threonine protein kinase [Streptomyces muensis]